MYSQNWSIFRKVFLGVFFNARMKLKTRLALTQPRLRYQDTENILRLVP